MRTSSAATGSAASDVGVEVQASPELIQDAMAWCAQHGLVYGAQNPADPCALVHAPFALTPVPFPRRAFERAVAASAPFNAMIDRVARDEAYLTSVLAAAAKGDPQFTGKLMAVYKVRAVGTHSRTPCHSLTRCHSLTPVRRRCSDVATWWRPERGFQQNCLWS